MTIRKLGRKIAHRKSLMRNLAVSLVLYEKVDTTLAKAKEAKSVVEKMITVSKGQDLKSYRHLLSYFYDKGAAKKLRDELSVRYKDRTSGFVRLYHLNNRLGDNSKMARLELVDRKVFAPVKKADTKKENESPKIEVEKIDKKQIKSERKIEKLSATEQKGGVTTSVRTKAARKTGV
jgi:large subunit ribosomal protein L17